VNALAQEAALACLQDVRYRQRTLQFFEKKRSAFRRALERIPGFRVYPSSANFFLVELTGSLTSRQVQASLMERGFLVRDCSNFPGLHERMLRIAVRTSAENARLVKHLPHVANPQP
jgi:threonine-phosphate decarboxylase